jgi:sodium transport system permease protein
MNSFVLWRKLEMRGTLTIFKKELKDTLRDRRTIIVMVVLPLLLFPIIFGIVGKLEKSLNRKAQEKQLRVAVIAPGSNTTFMEILGKQKDIIIVDDIPEDGIADAIQNESLEGAYVFSATFEKDIEDFRPGAVTFYFKSTDDQNIAQRRLREPLNIFEKEALASRFQRLNLESSIINPIKVNEVDVTTSKERFGKRVGGLLPYIFVIFCFLGSMYSAIDLAAGEKERGTIETLLVSPVNRLEIIGGKFMVVSLTGITSDLIALFSLYFVGTVNYFV